MKTTNAFLLLWNMNGIEEVHHISRYEKIEQENLLRQIAGKKPKPNPLDDHFNYLYYRARFNQHRHYELWGIDCEDTSIRGDDWIKWFDENPQRMADLVRSKGVCFYSDRAKIEEPAIR